MDSTSRPDFTDTRTVLWVYAAIAAAAGLVIGTRAVPGLTTTLPSGPEATRLFFALLGSTVLSAGCVAAGLAQVEEPRGRHRALGWFVAAHLVASVVLCLLGAAKPPTVGFSVLLGTTFLLSYFWQYGDGYRQVAGAGLIDLFGRHTQSADHLRSAYEERIRATASQEERHRLARELHDSIKQQIFAMQTAAATAQARMEADPAGAKEALDRLRDSGREAMTEMEAMLDSLQSAPIENVGLVEAIKKQGEALQLRSGAQVAYEFGLLPPSERLQPGTQQAVFRVAQEALANVGRHARAAHVRVLLGYQSGEVVLRIEDDGAGFAAAGPSATAGMGLASMRARAHAFNGTLSVRSAPGEGTAVTLGIPVGDDPPAGAAVARYRRHAIAWGVNALLLGLILTGDWILNAVPRSLPLLLALIGAYLVIALHAFVEGYRVRRRMESATWTKSPSRS